MPERLLKTFEEQTQSYFDDDGDYNHKQFMRVYLGHIDYDIVKSLIEEKVSEEKEESEKEESGTKPREYQCVACKQYFPIDCVAISEDNGNTEYQCMGCLGEP